MKQINLLGKGMKLLSFDSDGIYSVIPDNRTHIRFCQISEEEIKTLKDNIDKVVFPDIEDGDVLLFNKNTAFPKLMLGRLDLPIKRTVKKDKATKIIVNKESVISKHDLDSLESGYVIMVGGNDETDFNQIFFISDKQIELCRDTYLIDLDLLQKYFPGRWIKATILGDKITDDAIQMINSDPDNITTVQKVAVYLNSKLPTLDEESAKTMINLFKSGTEEKKLAINMLASFNVSNILIDVCSALGNSGPSIDQNTRNSINYKYFKILLGCDPSMVEDGWNSSYWYGGEVASALFNNGILTPDQKAKAWNHFYNHVTGSSYKPGVSRLSDYQRRKFDEKHMPYTYDQE